MDDIPTSATLIPHYQNPDLGKKIKVTNILYYDA
jgi:hypothetical protein